MKLFGVRFDVREIYQVVVTLMPRSVAYLGKKIPKMTLGFQIVDVQRTKIKAQVAKMNKTKYFTFDVFLRFTCKFGNLRSHAVA